MIKVNFTPKTDIEEYLSIEKSNHLYSYNYNLFLRLTEDNELKERFNPLEFFNLLYENIEIVKANKAKPHKVINHLLNLFTDKFVLIIFLKQLNIFFIFKNYIYKTGRVADNEIALFNKYFFEEIEKLEKEHLGELYKPNPMKYLYKFEYVRRELEHFHTKNEKINYLIEVITNVSQTLETIGANKNTPMVEKNFIKKCELEIQKLKDIEIIEPTKVIQDIPKEELIIAPLENYTSSQIVLIFYYFFKYNGFDPRNNVDIAPIAKFLHLITGRNYTTVQNSDFYKKLQYVPNFKSDKGLIKDLETIKLLFAKVELYEVVKLIDNEIDMARHQRKNKSKQI